MRQIAGEERENERSVNLIRGVVEGEGSLVQRRLVSGNVVVCCYIVVETATNHHLDWPEGGMYFTVFSP